jgi:hypothetical protein
MLKLPILVRPTIHIKGHQDDETDYDDLPLKPQLNCDADRLADDFLAEHDPDLDFSLVPMLPTAGCQLNLPKGTSTFNFFSKKT